MMQRLPTALLFFLIALCFSWNTAKAQELAALPDKIRGNWALPDCGSYDEALVFSRYFYLRSTLDSQSLLPAGLERQAEDYAILSLKDQKAPVQFESDGILTLGVLERPPARRTRHWPQSWENLSLDQSIEYTACTEPPSIVPPSMQRLMRYIDRIKNNCTLSVQNDCTRVLFKFVDDDNSNTITKQEIKQSIVSLALLAELASGNILSLEDGRKAIDRAKSRGDDIADTLMTHYDTNKSNDLDYNELVADVPLPALPLVAEWLNKVGNLMPAFRLAARAVPALTEEAGSRQEDKESTQKD